MSTELEQRLRGAMEQFTGDVRVPPGLAVKAYRHRQKRRVTPGRGRRRDGDRGGRGGGHSRGCGGLRLSRHPPVQAAYTAYVVAARRARPGRTRASAAWSRRTHVCRRAGPLHPVAPWAGSRAAPPQLTVGGRLHADAGSITARSRMSAVTAGGQRVFDLGTTLHSGSLSGITVDLPQRDLVAAEPPRGPARTRGGAGRVLRRAESLDGFAVVDWAGLHQESAEVR